MELKSNDDVAVRYHKIFDYKLTKEEAVRWQYKQNLSSAEGKNQKSERRLQREKYSKKKLEIAKNASELISKIPTVLFVGITGSLAMMNADKNSDIDLLLITKKNMLWTTRVLVYFVLRTMHYVLRKPQDKNERDALCLNMWLDETSLIWDRKDRNIYTAHEIAQIVPLVNKNNTYERFLFLNKWILNYWPNAVEIKKSKTQIKRFKSEINILEKIAFKLQYIYMKSKITTEIITPHTAIFHKNDWGKVVMKKLSY
ncbi:MAG: hypothetical protein WA152_01915 [Microgenomates group bacterium]